MDLPRKKVAKDSLNAEQLRFCGKLLGDLYQDAHWVSPFSESVGESALSSRDQWAFSDPCF